MDDLPDLPFEQVLSYLSLKERLKFRAVSRRWYDQINNFRVKSLCYSGRPSGFIYEKRQWIDGVFAQNFICSPESSINTPSKWSFFNTFSESILSNLKHLRLCQLSVTHQWNEFAETLNSFSHLERLDIIRLNKQSLNLESESNSNRNFTLTLPMLNSICIVIAKGIRKLTLDTPRLQKIKLIDSSLMLDIVHGDSVETLVICRLEYTEVKKLTNLKSLHCSDISRIDSTFLSDLEQLKEIHLCYRTGLSGLLDQMQRYGRVDLKVYQHGLLLNGKEENEPIRKDPFGYLIKHPSELAAEIQLINRFSYRSIERVAVGSEMKILNQFIDLNTLQVSQPVQDIERFLGVLKKLDRAFYLKFECGQPQQLFDRLPEHCEVQCLSIKSAPADVEFLFRLKQLVCLQLQLLSIDAEFIERAIEELEFLEWFDFWYLNKVVKMDIERSGRFQISVGGKKRNAPDLNAAIEFIVEATRLE